MKWSEEFLERFELRLKELLITNVRDEQFQKALLYQFFPAGKRVRPLLMAAFAIDLGIPAKTIVDYACALEILHTASLIHDDLPSLDNDSERRGRPTLHVKVGEGSALLAGDYLIARALSICAVAAKGSPSKSSALTALMANGFCDVCFGQELDIRNSVKTLDESLDLYDLKTGALFHISLSVVGILKFDEQFIAPEILKLTKLIGRAFQVFNDLKGIQNIAESSDARNERATAISLLKDKSDLIAKLDSDTWHAVRELELKIKSLAELNEFSALHLRDVLQRAIMVPT